MHLFKRRSHVFKKEKNFRSGIQIKKLGFGVLENRRNFF